VVVNALVLLAALLLMPIAHAQLIESFEGSANGWTISPFGSQVANFQILPPSTTGVTDGSNSLAVGPTVTNVGTGPNYSQLLISNNDPTSAYAMNVTNILANASDLKFDVLAPPGSFGGFLQFDTDINNSATGFVSLDGFGYPATTIGSEFTFDIPITAAIRSQLAGSGSGTTIIIQGGGGFSAGNETFYLDNIRATPAPEPASIGALALSGLLAIRRRR
jgi:hypothetical protein